ncbi:MAG: class I SAM-dependent methyltransferase [Caldisericia bacterium]
MKMISPEAGLSALDAGCGTGVFSAFLVKAGMDVTGFDESPEMLGTASKKKSWKSVR